MKLCVDCKHYRRGRFNILHIFGFGVCCAPQNLEIDPVTGEKTFRVIFAKTHRKDIGTKSPGYCNDAQWFEEK